MSIKEILLLGDTLLYSVSKPVKRAELNHIKSVVEDLHDTLMDFRKRYDCGRAIAAPQIGILKQLIYMNIDKPVVFINPKILYRSRQKITLWDDCMSFPDLLVKVKRHKTIKITYRDLDWKEYSLTFEDDLSELFQHEYDHLIGILAVSRAIDLKSFAIKKRAP
jgi:peptide deformylase